MAPDVMLVDPQPPDKAADIRSLREALPHARIVALGATASDVIPQALAGADGFLWREASLEDLVVAIECAARGESTLPPHLAARLIAHVAADRSRPSPWREPATSVRIAT